MAILDQYGNEIRANKPIRGELALDTFRTVYSTYPTQGLTPDRLALILREADRGNVYRQAEMFEEMEEKDCHLASIIGTRRLAVSGLRWEVLPASDARTDKKIAQAAKEMLDNLESLRDTLFDILDAVGKGFSMSEIMWDPTPSATWITEIKWCHPKKFTFQDTGSAGSRLLTYPRLLTDANPWAGEDIPAHKFVFHRHKARSGITPRGGLSRPCAYMWLFKNFDVKSWILFNELYSVPMRVGKYQSGASPDEINILKQATLAVASDAAAVISDNTLIELLETKNRGDSQAFSAFAEFCDRAMSKTVLGHTGSSESTAGKLGNDDQAKEIRQDILEADAEALETCVKFQILKPWALFNFGPDTSLPQFKLHYETPEDLEKTATVYGILVKDCGFGGIPTSHIYDRFSIPQPKDGEETVHPVPASSMSLPDGVTPPLQRGEAGRGANGAMANKAATVTDPQYTPAQQTIEHLKAATLDQGPAAMAPIIAQIKTILDQSTTIDEARGKILDAYGQLDDSQLATLLARAMFSANVIGRVDATP